MNNRCHDPIRKTPHLPGFYQKLLAGSALDKIKSLDVILPEQFTPVPDASPEKSLLIAVLADALHSIHRRERDQIEDIECWLSQSDKDSTARISFPQICRFLSLSKTAVRRDLLAAIAHAREMGLVGRRSHHRPWPKERVLGPEPTHRVYRRPRVKMVSLDGKRMSYRRLTDAILEGGF